MVRPWTLDDLEPFHSVLGDPRVVWWDEQAGSIEHSRTELERVLRRSRDDHPGLGWSAVLDRATAEVVANIAVETPAIETPGLELGWHVAVAHQGRGVATEAARGAALYARESLAARRLVALIEPENAASRRVAEKLGMTVEATVIYLGGPSLLYVAEV